MAKTPGDIARELGLRFTEEKSRDGRWVRFVFEFPDHDKVPVEMKTVTFQGVPKGYTAPPKYLDAVRGVATWRERVKPWLFVGTTDTVAAQLTLGNRLAVGLWNRKNRKKLKAAQKQLEASESYARSLALSQPTPMQGLKVLDDLAPKLAEVETQELRKKLVEASQLAQDAIAIGQRHFDGTCGCPGTPCEVAQAEKASGVTYEPMAEVIPLRKASA
jgi:hypothetical protein